MTQARILSLAYDSALSKWADINEFLKKYPNSRIWKAKKEMAWKELDEISAMLIEASKQGN